ncbi:helix-turn-helix domain-containing protein [Streptomyces sp. ID01-12c]|nr:helix-turn-helix domain-containing protein [Streptomyces caniscabiei]
MSFKVTNWVWARSESRNGARLVLLALADRADDKGQAWPSVDDLAERTKLSPRAVQKAIANLVEIGELEVENGGGRHRSNRYRIVPKPRTLDGVTDEKPRQMCGVSTEETPNSATETPNFEAETPNSATRNPVQSSPEPQEPSEEPSENLLPAPQEDAEDRYPAELTQLMDAMSLAGINLPWKFLGDDMIRVLNDIRRLGIPLMVQDAVEAKASATKPPFSTRFFYDRWHSIRTPAQPAPGERPPLRAVSGGYQPYREPTPEDRAADLGHF